MCMVPSSSMFIRLCVEHPHHFYINILQSFSLSSNSSKNHPLPLSPAATSPSNVLLTLKLTISYLWVALSTIALFFYPPFYFAFLSLDSSDRVKSPKTGTVLVHLCAPQKTLINVC